MVDRAIEVFEAGVARFPKGAEIHFNLGSAFQWQANGVPGANDRALTHYKKAFRIEPDRNTFREGYGLELFEQKRCGRC